VTESPAQNPQPQGPGGGAPGGGGPRRRKPPRRVTVTAVSMIAPRLVSVLVTGDELDGFTNAAPTSHLKLFLPPAGSSELLLPEQGPDGPVWNHDESLRPVIRTYTPRRYDPATKTLEIQVVLHGEGPASEWAQRVAVGDQVAVGGPGGRFVLDEAASHWWLAADESALPALGTLLDVLPETASAEVHVEVEDSDDVIKLPSAAAVNATWHYRYGSGDFSAALATAAREASFGGSFGGSFGSGTKIWVACESGVMRDIRRHLTRDRGIPVSQLVTRGYWRRGETNHPDHDYGED
jgi:NADPH-dependent ferric siderophore reductase